MVFTDFREHLFLCVVDMGDNLIMKVCHRFGGSTGKGTQSEV